MGEARRRREAGEDPRAGISCQRCGYGMDAATGMVDQTARPQPGDFSVCARCGLPMRFEEGCRLRALEVGEIEEMAPKQRAQLFIACAALGSQNNPMRQTEPGKTVARVFWGEVAGVGKGLLVKAEGPADIGLAIIVLAQGIANLDGFDHAQKNAAQALITALTGGRVDLPPFEVIRGGGSENA
jgi:hypothetical protein